MPPSVDCMFLMVLPLEPGSEFSLSLDSDGAQEPLIPYYQYEYPKGLSVAWQYPPSPNRESTGFLHPGALRNIHSISLSGPIEGPDLSTYSQSLLIPRGRLCLCSRLGHP